MDRPPRQAPPPRPEPPPRDRESEPPPEDPVDRTVADSFPASDPPSWWAGPPDR